MVAAVARFETYWVMGSALPLPPPRSCSRPLVRSAPLRVGLEMKVLSLAPSEPARADWTALRSASTFSRVLLSLERAATYADEAYLPVVARNGRSVCDCVQIDWERKRSV